MIDMIYTLINSIWSKIEGWSLLTNIFLAIIAYFSYKVAKNTLIANDSPRLVAAGWYGKDFHIKDNMIRTFNFIIENHGRGVALSTFILTKTNKEKEIGYYLSCPIKTLKSGSKKTIQVIRPDGEEITQMEIITKDFFNASYYLPLNPKLLDLSHLKTFAVPTKKISRWNYWKKYQIKRHMKCAQKQKNTFPDQLTKK